MSNRVDLLVLASIPKPYKHYLLSLNLIMGGKLYEREGQIEHASHDQTYLVHGQGRRGGLTISSVGRCF